MPTFDIRKELSVPSPQSDRARDLCRAFGLGRSARRTRQLECRGLRAEPGDVVIIVGASGSGKSCLLREVQQALLEGQAVNIGALRTPAHGAVIDAVADGLTEALGVLATAGLNDVYTLLQSPPTLSAGEAYRLRLALGLAMRPAVLCADDFGQGLDPITAAVVAGNLHRFAKRSGTTIILASSRNDFLADLEPDVIVETEFTAPATVIYKERRAK
jgi:hypothetical protein